MDEDWKETHEIGNYFEHWLFVEHLDR
jgi:hypothetical protein